MTKQQTNIPDDTSKSSEANPFRLDVTENTPPLTQQTNMSKKYEPELKNVKLATCKIFDMEDSQVHVIAISFEELFGKADVILVSKDKEKWIQHSYDDFMDAVNNGKPIKVA